MPVERVPDAGVQAERTALAWERTALLLIGTSAALLRMVALQVGAPAVGGCVIVAGVAIGVVWSARRRYRTTVRAMVRDVEREPDARVSMPSGRLPVLVTTAVVLLGAIALTALLVAAD